MKDEWTEERVQRLVAMDKLAARKIADAHNAVLEKVKPLVEMLREIREVALKTDWATAKTIGEQLEKAGYGDAS